MNGWACCRRALEIRACIGAPEVREPRADLQFFDRKPSVRKHVVVFRKPLHEGDGVGAGRHDLPSPGTGMVQGVPGQDGSNSAPGEGLGDASVGDGHDVSCKPVIELAGLAVDRRGEPVPYLIVFKLHRRLALLPVAVISCV